MGLQWCAGCCTSLSRNTWNSTTIVTENYIHWRVLEENDVPL